MTEDPNRRERARLMTSTRAAAMWLAFLAVVLGGVLLLTLWSTALAADRSWPWRWGSVATAAVGFLFLAWAMITAFGVFTHASASPADPGFLPVQPPMRFSKRRRAQSRNDLQRLLISAVNQAFQPTQATIFPCSGTRPELGAAVTGQSGADSHAQALRDPDAGQD